MKVIYFMVLDVPKLVVVRAQLTRMASNGDVI